MAIKAAQFKVRGMQRDNSESTFNPQFAFENMNMRVSARDNNTQLSLQNEQGNDTLSIIDIDTNEAMQLKGIPLGYSTIDNILVVFTTENKYPTDNIYDEGQLINLKSQFQIKYFRYFDLSSSSIRFLVSIEEFGNPKIADQLKMAITISYITSTGLTYNSPITKTIQGERFSDPTEGVSFLFKDLETDLQSIEAIMINHLSVYHKSKSLFECDTNTLFKLKDKGALVGNIDNILFPLYQSEQNIIEDSTQVTKNISGYKLAVLNGVAISTGENKYIVKNNEGYSESYSYYTYSNGAMQYQGTQIPTDSPITPETPYVSGLVLFNKQAEEQTINNITITPSSKIVIVGDKFELVAQVIPDKYTDSITLESSDQEICKINSVVSTGISKRASIVADSAGQCYITAKTSSDASQYSRSNITVQDHLFSIVNPSGDSPIQFTDEGMPVTTGNNLISVNSNSYWRVVIPSSYQNFIRAKVVNEVPQSQYQGNKVLEIYLEPNYSSIKRTGFLYIEPVNSIFSEKRKTINIVQNFKN